MQPFELLRWVWCGTMWMLSLVWWLRRQPHLAQVTFWASLDDLLSFSLHICNFICGDVTNVSFTFQRVLPVQAWVSFRLGVLVDFDARIAADTLSSSHEVTTPNFTWLSLNFLVEFYFDRSIYSALTQDPRTVRSWTSIHTWRIFWTCSHILQMVHISTHDRILASWRVFFLSTSAS